jgi:transposase
MRAPLRVRVRGRQLHCLRQLFRHSRCPRTRLRAQMVLLCQHGYPVEEIARITEQSDDTIRRWLNRFNNKGCAGLREQPRWGRPAKVTAEVELLLRQWALQSRDLGVNRPSWTTANLARLVERLLGVRVTDECIRRHLHRLDLVGFI